MSTNRIKNLNLLIFLFLTFVFSLSSAKACNTPTNLQVIAYSPTSITISWTGTSTTSFQIRYITQGGNLNFAPVSTITSNPYTITGLSVNTSYAIQVRELCTSGTNPWPAFIVGKTSCSVQSAPFTANFDGGAWTSGGFNSPGSINSCWFRDPSTAGMLWKPGPGAFGNNFTGPSATRSGAGKYMQVGRAGFVNTFPDSAIFESPLVDLGPLTNPQLSFWYHMFGANIEDFRIYVSNDFGQNYNLLQTITGQQQTSRTDSWLENPINLSAYANDTIRIRFVYYQSAFGTLNEVSIDDFAIEEAPSCPRPTQFANTLTTNNSANFSWTTGGATNWQISYGTPGFSPNTGTKINLNSNPGTINGLSPNTNYEAYVRDSCNASDQSPWTGPVSFRTKCNPLSAPYLENFDANGFSPGPGFNSIGNINNCWSRTPLTPFVWSTGPPTFSPTTTGPQSDHTSGSGQYIFTETIAGFSTNTLATLESPLIDLTALTNPELKFYLHSYGNAIGDLKTYVNNGSGWVLMDTQSGQQQNSKTDPWKEIIVSLASYVNDTITIKFVGSKSSNSTLADIAIDDVSVDEAPSCPRPQNLALIATASNSANIQWQSGGATNWNISYGSPGFNVNNGTIINAGSNPFNLTGLSSNSTYEIYVRDSCGPGDVSLWTGPITITTACSPLNAPYFENFEGPSWTVGSFTTPGGINGCWSRSHINGYYFTTNQGAGAIFNTGPSGDKTSGSGKYVYTTQQGLGSNNTDSEINSPQIDLSALTTPELRFWYHMFGNDIDKLEVLVSANGGPFSLINTISGQQQTSATAPWQERVVSLAAYQNDTISVKFRAVKTGTFSFSASMAIDDFRIDNSPTCPNPSGLTVNSTTQTSINIGWTSGGAINWLVQYRPTGSTAPFTIVSANSNPFSITGLSPSTNYEIFVRDSCAAGDVSFWTGPVFGQTACGVSTLPYAENFDNPTWVEGLGGFNFGDQINNCWSRTSATANIRWSTRSNVPTFSNGPSTDASGSGKFINFEAGNFGNSTDVITSPKIAIVNTSNPYLYFKYHMFGSGITNLQIRLNTQNNGLFILVKSIIGQQQNSKNSAWIEDSVNLSSYIGDTIEVVFRGQASGFNGDISVDELRIENLGPSCGAPFNLSLTNASYNSLDFSWQSSNTGAVTNLRWYPAAAGPAAATVVPNVSSPYSINGLNASTDYVIELFDSCSTLVSNSLIDTLSTQICDSVSADFTFNGRFLRRSFQSTATNNDSVFWQFGGLDSSFVNNPTYNFPAGGGTYAITLIAYNDCGNSDTIVKTITVCDTLRANFSNTFFNDSTRFIADPGNNATGYSWDLDDGFTAQGDTAAVKYNDANTKVVTLTSWNACGDTVRNTRNIPGCLPPKADWTYTILSPINSGLRIQFDASLSTNGSNYSWDFGDGNTGTGINPIHIYTTPGLQYKVKLTVTNNCGGRDVREFRLNQLSLDEEEILNSVEVFPNPSDGLVYLTWDYTNLKVESIELYNLQGQSVLRSVINEQKQQSLNLSDLSSGLYQVILKSDLGYFRQKIVVK